MGGVFFDKKSGKLRCFFKKWKMGGGAFCKKTGPFLNAGCIMYSTSIFYFTFYLFGGAYAPNAPPPPAYGPENGSLGR